MVRVMSNIDIDQIIKALREVVEDYTDFCIDDDTELEAMDEFCDKANIEDDVVCEELWDAIMSHFYDIVKIRIEISEEDLRKTIDEMRNKDKKMIRIDGVKTMDEMLNEIRKD